MLLVIFSGITYAFFSASNNKGSTSVLEVKSGKMIISYADGKSSLLVSNDIVPSSKIIIDKTFTLTGTNTTSGLSMPYKVGIKYTSSFSDGQIHYYIKEVDRPISSNVTVNYTGETNQTVPGNSSYTGYTHGTLKNGNQYIELATGEFPASNNNQTITFNLIMQFPDTGENQDIEKSKSINAYIEINHELNASEYIANLDKETNGLEIDDTEDKNLRYVGATPNNYISFNNETWRIIGIFDVINSDTNMKESLVKIIRNNSLGTYSWDTSDTTINNAFGDNDWSKSDLMQELNGDYLNYNLTSNTLWYNGIDAERQRKTAVFNYTNVIKQQYQNYINNTIWNLGAISNDSQSIQKYYEEERGTLKASPSKPVTWSGKIGLLYGSDYGYASTSENCKSNQDSPKCNNENWLAQTLKNAHTLTTTNFNNIYPIKTTSSYLSRQNAYNNCDVYPSLYLKSDTKIASGTGTESDPFVIE